MLNRSPEGSTNLKTMTLIRPFELDQFDLLWRDLFNSTSHFADITNKITHPTDIYETDKGIVFEIAAVGLNKEDIEIITEGEVLRIRYKKEDKEERPVIYRGIKRSSFDLAWKVASKFDLSQAEAKMEKGLLSIEVPFAESKKPNVLKIK
jgi:HSP20 family molecular chaperone IbpA